MTGPAGQPGIELDRLKELLLRPETDRLGVLESRVESIDGYVGDKGRLEAATSEILVDAFRRAEIAQHRELATAIAPVVVAAIRSEIKNSKDMMVEALYPITGRLVAAAVANAFRDLVADLNERLDRTLSTRHWQLRFQSIVTGRPVSELALADAQRPVLRRLLLLERGSGKLMAGWHSDTEQGDQSELVSGLIAAITEFASSVYGARSGELRTLDLGDARVFLRGAPVYLVAAECAGALKPEHERELDDAFLSLVSRIDHAPEAAQGAVDSMAATLFRSQQQKAKSTLPLLFATAALLALFAWFASGPILRSVKERKIDSAFAQAVAAHPELKAWPLHVAVDHSARSVTVEGLDPSDAAAKSLAEAIGEAAAPYSVAQRTAAIGVAAQIDALQKQLAEANAQIASLEKNSRDAIDRAFGQAVDKANAQTSAAARDLQSQTQASSDRLGSMIAASTPTQRERTASLLARTAIFFPAGGTTPVDAQLVARKLDEIAAAIKGADLALRVIGQADASGSARINANIAQARADSISAMLVERGVDASRLRTAVRAATELRADPRDRRVTFELAYDDEPTP